MSKRQAVTAIRVANIPGDDFEQLVESDNPPTVTTSCARTSSGSLWLILTGAAP